MAEKRASGRRVALKFVSLNPLDRHDADDDPQEAIERELQAVRKLNRKNIVRGGGEDDDQRDLSIVFFEEWFRQDDSFACIVMKYADGGTLAQEIERKSKTTTADGDELYAERRIAWYALQLAEALAFAHERGVAHHDVKSSNVLIDRKSGGKLLLADFDSAVAPGEESVAFTKSYASPELLDAFARDELAGLQADKIDAYGLGCILYELLCCQKLGDLSKDQTLAEFIQQKGVDAALGLPPLRLPWIPPADTGATQNVIGYSNELKNLVKTLLEPDPSRRWTPSSIQKPLRTDDRCPLLRDTVVAAKKLIPGAAVSVDNVQLGMFVQRGQDWNDEDAGGGIGRIGVVCKLDADAIYTEVAWRCDDLQNSNNPSEPSGACYRIGAGNKFELQVGPTPLAGTCASSWNGVVEVRDDMSRYRVGQKVYDDCMVVGFHPDQKHLLVIPLALFFDVPTLPHKAPIPESFDIPRRQPQSPPESWQSDGHLIVEVTDLQEKGDVVEEFYSTNGGMDIQEFEVVSVKRVQSVEMWSRFAREMASVAAENWGLSNQRRLFLGTRNRCPEALVRSRTEISPPALDNLQFRFFAGARFADQHAHRQTATSFRTIVLSRVTLGRLKDNPSCNYNPNPLPYHSERHAVDWRSPQSSEQYSIRNMTRAFFEYIITYRPIRGITFSRRVRVSPSSSGAPRASPAVSRTPAVSNDLGTASSTSGSSAEPKGGSATKQCVVCLSQPVSRILIPCGHPCLCQLCSTQQGLDKLRQKCPECRAPIREAAKFYGRVVND